MDGHNVCVWEYSVRIHTSELSSYLFKCEVVISLGLDRKLITLSRCSEYNVMSHGGILKAVQVTRDQFNIKLCGNQRRSLQKSESNQDHLSCVSFLL